MVPRGARPPRCPQAGLAVALILALGAGGCSFHWVKPAPPRDEWPNPESSGWSEERCTTSVGPPVADTVVGVALGTLAFIERNSVSYSVQDMRYEPDVPSRAIAGVLGIGGLVALASAVYGYVQTTRCDHYQSHLHP